MGIEPILPDIAYALNLIGKLVRVFGEYLGLAVVGGGAPAGAYTIELLIIRFREFGLVVMAPHLLECFAKFEGYPMDSNVAAVEVKALHLVVVHESLCPNL